MNHPKSLLTAVCVLTVLTLSGPVFAQSMWPALPETAAALVSDSSVTVDTVIVPGWDAPNDYYLTFTPTGPTPSQGFIIHPGAYVEPAAYAITARAVAEAGFFVAIMSAKNGITFPVQGRTDVIIADNPQISIWSIGGHSMGGVTACVYASSHDSTISGVVLWASYPASDISAVGVKVVSIYGTQDNMTNQADIDASVANLPDDTQFVRLEGANHTQFGYYDVSPYPVQPGDTPASITRAEQNDLINQYTLNFLDSLTPKVPPALDTVNGADGSVWEKVAVPGFGNTNNCSVVAMAEYQGRIYAMTRNDIEGAEIWRSTETGWEQMTFPGGETNGMYGNTALNNVWGRMAVFNGKLYVGLSSGFQGAVLYSTGAEIWSYDGVVWEPVISDLKDSEEAGTISAIAACDNTGDTLGQITDNTKSWALAQWAGGTLTVNTPEGKRRKFYIVWNSADTLYIQQNETAGTGPDQASETEQTECADISRGSAFPKYSYNTGSVQVGNAYEIGTGSDESGFGEFWNKTITDMEVIDGKLYVSIGLNYDYGAQVWYTPDGENWTVTTPANSFGNFHDDPNYRNGQKPVSTSITNLVSSSVSGEPVLYAGGTGASGNMGSCARMAKLTPTGWELIVDGNVDANDTGSNENGFGDGMDCVMQTGNFMPWSLEEYKGVLYAATQSLNGGKIVYTNTGSSEDGSWFYTVGGGAGMLDIGFGGDPLAAIAFNLFSFKGTLFAGSVATFVPEYPPPTGVPAENLTGAKIYYTNDGINWTRITSDGFGDPYHVIFEAFVAFDNSLYVSGSKGASSSPAGLGGSDIFRLSSAGSTLIELSALNANPGHKSVTIRWATASEVDNAGFNVYRSETKGGVYVQINAALIPAKGSALEGASYNILDTGLKNGKTYYYKLEDIDTGGTATEHGPVSATPRLLAGILN